MGQDQFAYTCITVTDASVTVTDASPVYKYSMHKVHRVFINGNAVDNPSTYTNKGYRVQRFLNENINTCSRGYKVFSVSDSFPEFVLNVPEI